METNEAGIALIKKFEGLRLSAYICPAGKLTIGYGHLVQFGEPQRITAEQADQYLIQDLARFERGVRGLLKAKTSSNQFSALVSFAYNVGTGALANSTLLRHHNAGFCGKAAQEFVKWNKAKVNRVMRPLAGLTDRRKAEQALYATPDQGGTHE